MHVYRIWKNSTDERYLQRRNGDADIENGLVDTAGEGEGRMN